MISNEKQSTYFDHQSSLATIFSSTDISLFIQRKKMSAPATTYHFSIYRGMYHQGLFPLNKNTRYLKIALDMICNEQRSGSIYIPLEHTRKMSQLADLLFLNYSIQ